MLLEVNEANVEGSFIYVLSGPWVSSELSRTGLLLDVIFDSDINHHTTVARSIVSEEKCRARKASRMHRPTGIQEVVASILGQVTYLS